MLTSDRLCSADWWLNDSSLCFCSSLCESIFNGQREVCFKKKNSSGEKNSRSSLSAAAAVWRKPWRKGAAGKHSNHYRRVGRWAWRPETLIFPCFRRSSSGATMDEWTINPSWALLRSSWTIWTCPTWWLAGLNCFLPPHWWTQPWPRWLIRRQKAPNPSIERWDWLCRLRMGPRACRRGHTAAGRGFKKKRPAILLCCCMLHDDVTLMTFLCHDVIEGRWRLRLLNPKGAEPSGKRVAKWREAASQSQRLLRSHVTVGGDTTERLHLSYESSWEDARTRRPKKKEQGGQFFYVFAWND